MMSPSVIHIRSLLILVAGMQLFSALSQPSVSQSVFAVAGFSATTNQLVLSSTLGESFIFGGQEADFSGCQGFQSGAGLTTTAIVPIDRMRLQVLYYPNPTQDGITIQWDQQGEYAFELYSTLGQMVKIHPAQRADRVTYIPLTGLAEGLYGIFVRHQNFSPAFAGWIMYQPQ